MTKITMTKLKTFVDGEPLAAPDPQPLAAPITIDMTPTWSGILPALVAVLQSGTAEGQAIALDELRRMAALADSVKRMAARADKAETERDELRAAIFGSPDYAPDLRNGNFREMAETLHAARAGAVERAEIAESRLETLHAAAPELLALVKQFRDTCEYYIKQDRTNGDHEGARLKTLTLMLCDGAIAKAGGVSNDQNQHQGPARRHLLH